jgi:hypothetical protein
MRADLQRFAARLTAMEDAWERARSLHRAAGVPDWAPYSVDIFEFPHVFVWVDDDNELGTALIGRCTENERIRILKAGRRALSGTEERRPGLGPRDLGQRAALAELTRDDLGHGPLERGVLRPLGELIEFAVAKLSVPLDSGDTS